MMLRALIELYGRLENDSDVDIAPFGFSRQKISFCIVLNKDGSLHELADARKEEGKRQIPLSLEVLGNAKPSGSGINPCFLWDNPAYLLGYKADDPKPERTRESFEAFRARHLEAESEINDEHFSAVCRFLESWQPESALELEKLLEVGTGFGAFRIRLEKGYVHQREAVVRWWKEQLAESDQTDQAPQGQCLVTGEVGPLARLHEPKIKGVRGAQSSGAALVSFNLDAFDSYGKSQSINSPVHQAVAFQYCTALNYLLASKRHRVIIGDTTTVFWTGQPCVAENLFSSILGASQDSEDDAQRIKVHTTLTRIRQGVYPHELGEPPTRFYVLGLAPNAARISVRFWYESTLKKMVANLHHHFDDLEMVHGPKEPDHPAPWQILRETVRDAKDIPDLLEGAFMRAILTGYAYPQMLYTAILRRIRADREVRYLRVATLKAFLNRNHRLGIQPLERSIPMSLDPNREEPAYHMGRLFAELEKTQEEALPGINDTIKDRFFGSASATPASVFPRLIKLNQHHLGKLEKPARVYREKRIQDIADRLIDFSSHLALKDQGLFAIGYYHQRQDIFTKKNKQSDQSTNE